MSASDHIGGDESDMLLKPGMIIMAEPNPITADGMFGIFLGHTFIVTDTRARGGGQVPAGDRGGGLTGQAARINEGLTLYAPLERAWP